MLSTLINTSLIAALSFAAVPVEESGKSQMQRGVNHVAVLAAFGDAHTSRTVEQQYCARIHKERPYVTCTSLRSAGTSIDENDNAAFVDLARQEQADHVLFISWAGLSVQTERDFLRFRELSLEEARERNFGIARNGDSTRRGIKNEFTLSLVSLNSGEVVQSADIDTYGLVHSGVRTVSRSIARMADDRITLLQQ